jgi:riboflavin synthase
MFTGLVETTGVLRRRAGSPVARAFIETSLGPLELGESISVDGACLTVDRIAHGGFECDMSAETLARTTLGELALGAAVHLERSTPLGGRMGGHMVLGHVDGVGRVSARELSGDALRFEVTIPGELARFVASKGSIAIDGVSLTVNAVSGSGAELCFDVMLVPHTLGRTLLGKKTVGSRVNIEVDVLARYVARQLGVAEQASGGAANAKGAKDASLLEKLRSGGWV